MTWNLLILTPVDGVNQTEEKKKKKKRELRGRGQVVVTINIGAEGGWEIKDEIWIKEQALKGCEGQSPDHGEMTTPNWKEEE